MEAQAHGTDCSRLERLWETGHGALAASQGSAMRAGHGHLRGSWSGGRGRQWRLGGTRAHGNGGSGGDGAFGIVT